MMYLLVLLVCVLIAMFTLGSIKYPNDDETIPGVIIEKKSDNFEIIVEIDYLGKEQYSYFPSKIEYDLFEEGQKVICIFDNALDNQLKYVFR